MRVLVSLFIAVLLCGCGGLGDSSGTGGGNSGGGGGVGVPTFYSVTIEWAAPVRTIGAPPSAYSALVELSKNGSDSKKFVVNRNQNYFVDHTETYISREQVLPGFYRLIVTYYTAPILTGSVSAKVMVDVKVQDDGTITARDDSPLGYIPSEPTFDRLMLPEEITLTVGETLYIPNILATRTGGSSTFEVPSWMVQFQIISGSAHLKIEGGSFRGLSPGHSEITITLDGITSDPQEVIIK